MEQFDRITTDVTRINGEPCIRDLRLTVRRVLEALATYPDRAVYANTLSLRTKTFGRPWHLPLPLWMTRSCPYRRPDETSA